MSMCSTFIMNFPNADDAVQQAVSPLCVGPESRACRRAALITKLVGA